MANLKSNIVTDAELKDIMKDTLQFLSDVLKNTLGPYGSTTIIQDRLGAHHITKDGYSLLKKIFIEEEVNRTILDMVISISKRLVHKVGDGSTSSIIVANALYDGLTHVTKEYNIPPKNLLTLLDEITEIVAELIKEIAVPIDENMDNLKYVAAVSSNNDLNYGTIIADIYKEVGRFGFIDLQTSKTESTYYEITNGFELPRGFIIPIMANTDDKKRCEYDDAKVLIINGAVTEEDMEPLMDIIGAVCFNESKPLCIVAKSYDQATINFLQYNMNKLKNTTPMKLVCVDYAMDGIERQSRVADICIATGATMIDKMGGETLEDYTPESLGQVNRVVASETYCRLIEGHGDKETIGRRVAILEEEIEEKQRTAGHMEVDKDVYDLRKRIATLRSKMAVLYVGGHSEDAKSADYDLFEDSIFACRSALNFGIVPGGNLVVPLVIHENFETIISQLKTRLPKYDETFISDVLVSIKDSFLESYTLVLNNCFQDKETSAERAKACIENRRFLNLKDDEEIGLFETTIVNSAETDIEIFKASISIIGLLATSNQFISVNTRYRN